MMMTSMLMMVVIIIMLIIIIIIACRDIRMTIDDQAFHDFTNMSFEKMTLLGAPLVPGPAVDMVLQSKANDLERAIRRLSILHTHDALVLLRNSLSVPKLIY